MQANTKHWCDVMTDGHRVLGEMPLCPPQIPYGPGCDRTWVSTLAAGDTGLIVGTANCNIKLVEQFSQFLPHGKHDLDLNNMSRLMPLIKIIALLPKYHTK
jgi:dihydrodipicolinate synthase/N-acetylneuraminate lyase